MPNFKYQHSTLLHGSLSANFKVLTMHFMLIMVWATISYITHTHTPWLSDSPSCVATRMDGGVIRGCKKIKQMEGKCMCVISNDQGQPSGGMARVKKLHQQHKHIGHSATLCICSFYSVQLEAKKEVFCELNSSNKHNVFVLDESFCRSLFMKYLSRSLCIWTAQLQLL